MLEPEVVSKIAVRVDARPTGWEPDWTPPKVRRVSSVVLSLEATSDPKGHLSLAAFALSHTDAPQTPLRLGFVLPPDGASDAALEAEAKRLGADVLSHRGFVGLIRRTCFYDRAVLVAEPATLGLLAVRTTSTRRPGGLSLQFRTYRRKVDRSGRRRVKGDAWIPGVGILARDGKRSNMWWIQAADRRSGGGPIVSVLTLVGAQLGRFPASLGEAAVSLGLPAPKEGHSPAAVLERALTAGRVYAKLAERHRSLTGGIRSPGAMTTGGSYGRAIIERTGLVPPLSRPGFLDHDPRILGTFEAYHGAELLLGHRGGPIDGCTYFDIMAEYVLAAIHVGAWGALTAKTLHVRDLDPKTVSRRASQLTEGDLYEPAHYRRWGLTFIRVVAAGGVFPHRVSDPDGGWRTKIAPLRLDEPLLYSALDVARSVVQTGRVPEIVSAFRIEPQGRVAGLVPFKLPGTGEIDPAEDLFLQLLRARVRVQTSDPEAPLGPWTARDLAAALKTSVIALIGSFAQILPQPERSRPVPVKLTDGSGEVRTCPTRRPETPGDWYCPPLGSAILAAGRSMGYALRRQIEREGGPVLYGATDSAICSGLSPEAALRIGAAFEPLNPTGLGGPRITAGANGLRMYPEHRDGSLVCRIVGESFESVSRIDEAGEPYHRQIPLRFFGWHMLRYIVMSSEGRPVRWSEHGVGDLVDEDLRPLGSEWIGQALAHLAGAGPEPEGLDRPRLVVQPANRPSVSAAYLAKPGFLRAWRPIVLAFEERPLRMGERILSHPWAPGFELESARWRTWGSGVPVRGVRTTGNADNGPLIRIQTIREYLSRWRLTPERGTADKDGRPCGLGTTGPLEVRPSIALSIRRVGREAHDVGEWRPSGRRRPAIYNVNGSRLSQGPATDTFRDSCRILARETRNGKPPRVETASGRKVPDRVVLEATGTRTAPPSLRARIVEAAARVTAQKGLGPAEAVVLAARTCWAPGCSKRARVRWCPDHVAPASRVLCIVVCCGVLRDGRSRWCAHHRAEADRDRWRRYRARQRGNRPIRTCLYDRCDEHARAGGSFCSDRHRKAAWRRKTEAA